MVVGRLDSLYLYGNFFVMVSISDRIKNIGGYFTSFNIAESTVYALVTFPQKWTVIPTLDVNGAEVKIVKDNKSNGYYFFTDLANGADCVFDAIDEIIKFNQSIEEKTRLLKEKAQELKALFETEDIEKLRTLRFTFGVPVNKEAVTPEPETKKKENKKGGKNKGKKDKKQEEPVEKKVEETPSKLEKGVVDKTKALSKDSLINNGEKEEEISKNVDPIIIFPPKNVEGDSLLDTAAEIIMR